MFNIGFSCLQKIDFILVNIKTGNRKTLFYKLNDQRQPYISKTNDTYPGASVFNLSYKIHQSSSIIFRIGE